MHVVPQHKTKLQLLLQAHMHTEAAQLLMQLAKTEANLHAAPLRLKKLYLLAALELDAFKARMLQIGEGVQGPTHPGSPQRPGSTASHTLAGDTWICMMWRCEVITSIGLHF